MEDIVKSNILKNRNLHIIFIITLFAVMGVASITPAFPTIIRYFEISPKKVGLLITAFTLPSLLLTPVMGVLADRVGRKIILVPSLFIFGIAGSMCALTKNFDTLLILRFVQGIGASSLGTLNITLIGDLFSNQDRAAAMGYNASVLSIGTASYPFIGGALAMLGWNYPFYITLLAIPAGLAIIWGLKTPKLAEKQNMKQYISNVWKNINKKNVWGIFIITTLLFVMIYGVYLTYFPLLLENRLGANSFHIGVTMSVMSFTTAFISFNYGKISKRLNFHQMLIFGFILYSVCMFILSGASTWIMIIFPVLLFGLGQGMLIPTVQNYMVGLAPMKERAAFMSINSVVLRLGQTVGPLIIGIFYGMGGIHWAFLAGACVAILQIIIKVVFIKK